MKYIIAILLLYITTSCNFTNQDLYNNSVDIVKVDPDKAEEIKVSDIIDSIRYLSLENTTESLLGEIKKIESVNSEFYVLDSRTNRVLRFDSDGKYLNQIGRMGQGPGEYIKVSDFNIDKDKKYLFLLDRESRRILNYSINGEFISSYPIKVMAAQFISQNDGFWLFTGGSDHYTKNKSKDLDYNLFFTDKNNTIKNRYCSFDPSHGNIIVNNVFDVDYINNSVLFRYGVSDTIYEVKEKCSPKYYVDFGKSKLPKENIKENSNKSEYAKILNIKHFGENLFINYSFKNRIYSTLKTKNKFTNCSFIENDLDETSFALFEPIKIIDNKMYFIKPSDELIDSYKQDTILLKSTYNTKTSITLESNPVIVIAYLK